MKIHNFSAGPSILPQSVFQKASQAVLDLNNSGVSILEISHRSDTFVEICERAMQLVQDLLNIPEGYHILFLSGGASSQFFMAPLNCLPQEGAAAYIDTGTWSTKAIKEAGKYGDIRIIASGKKEEYRKIPRGFNIPDDVTYTHFTSNNTIYGTQWHAIPQSSSPLFCDMSSDIFSKHVDLSGFGLIYAGAQKNMGPAGTTLVIIRDDMLGRVNRVIPSMLNYKNHIEKKSMLNTPPVYAIYVSMLTLEWLKENGGISFMEKRNKAKSELFYNELDRNGMFDGIVNIDDRSVMNATFSLKNSELENEFVALCREAGCSGIKGHRSVGGFRASMYNAMEIESVRALVEVMQQFETEFG